MERLAEFLGRGVDADVAKVIARIARTSLAVRELIPESTEVGQGVNPSGERQTKIDVSANDLFTSALIETGSVAEVASEETAEPTRGSGALHVGMDPLDGSSNISTNNPLGSIFGVYSSALPCSGERMVAAVFVTYGPMLTLTFAAGDGMGVQRFVCLRGEFVLMDRDIRLPEGAEVFGFGGLRRDWVGPVERFVVSLEGRGMKLRYGGTFAGDYNQVLKYGGIFGYPALRSRPKGKLRLLYETAPMAYVTEMAGGASSDGSRDLLDVEPKELAETSPAYLGSEALVRELEREIKKG